MIEPTENEVIAEAVLERARAEAAGPAIDAGATDAADLPLARNRDFQVVLLGQGLSSFGDAITFTALPILVLALTGSGLAMAIVGILGNLPDLVLGLPAGAFADRLDRRRMMLAADVGRAILTAVHPDLGGPERPDDGRDPPGHVPDQLPARPVPGRLHGRRSRTRRPGPGGPGDVHVRSGLQRRLRPGPGDRRRAGRGHRTRPHDRGRRGLVRDLERRPGPHPAAVEATAADGRDPPPGRDPRRRRVRRRPPGPALGHPVLGPGLGRARARSSRR